MVDSESPTPKKGEKGARQSNQRGLRRRFVGYEKESEAIHAVLAVLAAWMLIRGILFVVLVLMQVREQMTVKVRTQLRVWVQLWVTV